MKKIYIVLFALFMVAIVFLIVFLVKYFNKTNRNIPTQPSNITDITGDTYTGDTYTGDTTAYYDTVLPIEVEQTVEPSFEPFVESTEPSFEPSVEPTEPIIEEEIVYIEDGTPPPDEVTEFTM